MTIDLVKARSARRGAPSLLALDTPVTVDGASTSTDKTGRALVTVLLTAWLASCAGNAARESSLAAARQSNAEQMAADCELGMVEACVALSAAALGTTPNSVSPQTAIGILESICFSGPLPAPAHLISCGQLASVFAEKQQPDKTIAAMERACVGGVSSACTLAARMVAHYRNDHAAAASLAERGCNLGDGAGCDFAGLSYAVGRGVAPDAVKAVYLLERACGLGVGNACSSAGRRRLVGIGVPEEPGKAAPLYFRGCELADAASCNGAGIVLFQGRGMRRDQSRGVVFFRKACDQGDMDGCVNLADAQTTGDGVAQNTQAAKRLYMMACGEKSWAAGCRALALNYLRVHLDPEEQRWAFGKVAELCTPEDDDSCAAAGALAMVAKVALPTGEVARVLAAACEKVREPDADTPMRAMMCTRLGQLHASGDGVPQDAIRALSLTQRGCDLGDPDACQVLQKLGMNRGAGAKNR